MVNLGEIGYPELRSVYQSTQACLVPTVLESMSGTHLEALQYELPIVTADRDFAREACGMAADYYVPGDVDGAIHQLQRVAVSASQRREVRNASPQRGWAEVGHDFAAMIESIRHPDGRVRHMTEAKVSAGQAGSGS